LISHLLENFPGERRVIGTLIKSIRAFSHFELPSASEVKPGLKKKLPDLFALARHLPSLLKYGTLSTEALCGKTTNADLAKTLRSFVHFGGSAVPLLSITLPLAYAGRGDVGIPQGGWLAFSKAMAKQFTDLGGKIEYAAKVDELIVESKQEKGVTLANGAAYDTERVLTAIDGYFLDKHLLHQLPQNELRKRYAPETISEQPVQVNIGVAMNFSDMLGPVTFFVEPNIEIAGRRQHRIEKCGGVTTAAQSGQNAVMTMVSDDA
jgi:phytoene dehydrogenase-like protein